MRFANAGASCASSRPATSSRCPVLGHRTAEQPLTRFEIREQSLRADAGDLELDRNDVRVVGGQPVERQRGLLPEAAADRVRDGVQFVVGHVVDVEAAGAFERGRVLFRGEEDAVEQLRPARVAAPVVDDALDLALEVLQAVVEPGIGAASASAARALASDRKMVMELQTCWSRIPTQGKSPANPLPASEDVRRGGALEVGGVVVGLLLRAPLGLDPRAVELDLARRSVASSQPSTSAISRAAGVGGARGRDPTSRSRSACAASSTSSRCSAPSCAARVADLDRQVVVGARQRLAELRALGDQRQQVVDPRAVAAQQVLDARDVQPARLRRRARAGSRAPGSRRRRAAA